MPPKPLPHWFTPGDPWLTARMRQLTDIDAGEARLGEAVTRAMGEFLDAARDAVLGPEPTVVVAAGVEPPPPDFSQWPDESAWQRLVDRYILPVVSALFGERFRAATARADIADYPFRQSYLAEVWSRLKLWPTEAWDDIQPELAEGIAEGEDTRQLRERVGEALKITARSRRLQAAINQLSKTIADPATRSTVRREARSRRSALYRSKDREDQRWWFYAARIARTETLGALNGGTFSSAQALQEQTGVEKFKQWWCLTPENQVSAAGVTWVARRDYDGPVVRLTTLAGVMTLTPHHPVLTPGGWREAGALARGAQVVRLASAEGGRGIGDIAERCLASASERGFSRYVERTLDGGVVEKVQVCPPDPYIAAECAPGPDESLTHLARAATDDVLALLADEARPAHAARDRHVHPAGPDALTTETVSEVQLGHYAGPVYDFTTTCGYFAGPGGLLVHNSTTDNRVRPSHWAAHMQVQPLGEKFHVGGATLDHPGDPTGPAHEVINCRCSLLTMGRDEADAERVRYEQFKPHRTDIHGRYLDEQGRPVVAAATVTGADMTADDAVPAADDDGGQAQPGGLTWAGVLAPLGTPSGDNRRIDAPEDGQLATREMPVPLLYQPRLAQGHADAEQGLAVITAARIATGEQVREQGLVPDGTEVDPEARFLVGEGRFDAGDPEAVQLARKIGEGYLRWVSVDLDKVGKPRYHKYRDEEDLGPVEIDEPTLQQAIGAALDEDTLASGQFGIERDADGAVTAVGEPWAALEYAAHAAGAPNLRSALNSDAGFRARLGVELDEDERAVEAVSEWRLMSATLVSQPAFPEAFVTLHETTVAALDGDDEGIVDSGVIDDECGLADESVLAQMAQQVNAALDADGFAVTGDTGLPLAERDRPWDGAGAKKRLAVWARNADGKIDAAKYARVHLYRDPEGDPAAASSYKLPFADVIGGRVTIVPRGVFAAAAAVQGSRGGVQLAQGDADGVKRKLSALYGRIRDKEGDEAVQPPWHGGSDRSRSRIDWSKPTSAGRKRNRFAEDKEDAAPPKKREKVTVVSEADRPNQRGTVVSVDEATGTAQVKLDGLDRTITVKLSALRRRATGSGEPPPKAPSKRSAALTAAAESWAHRTAELAAELHEPPAEFFEDPKLTRPTNPTVTETGRVFGHIHDWKTSHIGYPGRAVRAPSSKSGYAYFNLKPVRCANGDSVRCGALVLGAHHASTNASANQATDHYDHSGYRVARIRVGADEHGTWFSGALVPGVTPEQVLDIAELTCSGDWRHGELRAALLVNVPGLPIVEGDGAEPVALVAAGALVREDGELGIAELGEAVPAPGVDVAELARAIVCEQEALAARKERVSRLSRHVHAPEVLGLAHRVYNATDATERR